MSRSVRAIYAGETKTDAVAHAAQEASDDDVATVIIFSVTQDGSVYATAFGESPRRSVWAYLGACCLDTSQRDS